MTSTIQSQQLRKFLLPPYPGHYLRLLELSILLCLLLVNRLSLGTPPPYAANLSYRHTSEVEGCWASFFPGLLWCRHMTWALPVPCTCFRH